MPVRLLPCPGCARHVRAGERECPFCGGAIEVAGAPAVRRPTTRLGRAATFAFGAAVATTLSVAGCGDDGTGGDVDSGAAADSGGGADVDSGSSGDDAGGAMADAGGDAGGSGDDAGAAVDAGGPMEDDAGGVGPLYGAVPVDAGMRNDDAGGGPAPLYGAPPTPA